MPAASPGISEVSQGVLADLGMAIKTRRRQLGVSAAVAAESAGMSRVTLHRVESGASSVTVGALMNAAEAVGLRVELRDAAVKLEEDHEMEPANPGFVEEVRVGDFPLLRAAAWQLDADTRLDGFEALRTYERNWRHIDHAAMGAEEKALVQALADRYSRGVLLV